MWNFHHCSIRSSDSSRDAFAFVQAHEIPTNLHFIISIEIAVKIIIIIYLKFAREASPSFRAVTSLVWLFAASSTICTPFNSCQRLSLIRSRANGGLLVFTRLSTIDIVVIIGRSTIAVILDYTGITIDNFGFNARTT